jgi:hypothetical protein
MDKHSGTKSLVKKVLIFLFFGDVGEMEWRCRRSVGLEVALLARYFLLAL